MINTIKNIITNNKNVDGYKITEEKIQSNELFLVKKSIDMDRAKDVHHFKIVIYKDIEEDNIKYRGAATINIHPTMSESEIEIAINEAVFAAKFAKNPYYPLVKNSNLYKKNNESNFSSEDLPHWINEITKAVYKNDIYENGGINSCEIFLNKVYTRIINSEGVDVQGLNYKCMVEYIPTWNGENVEVELYKCLNFSSFDPTGIAGVIATIRSSVLASLSTVSLTTALHAGATSFGLTKSPDSILYGPVPCQVPITSLSAGL